MSQFQETRVAVESYYAAKMAEYDALNVALTVGSGSGSVGYSLQIGYGDVEPKVWAGLETISDLRCAVTPDLSIFSLTAEQMRGSSFVTVDYATVGPVIHPWNTTARYYGATSAEICSFLVANEGNTVNATLTAENGSFVRYENTGDPNPNNEMWTALSLRTARSHDRGLGKAGPRDEGIVFVQVFAPLGTGAAAAEAMADTIVGWFNGVRLGDTSFRETQPVFLGEVEGWYQINLNIEFVTD